MATINYWGLRGVKDSVGVELTVTIDQLIAAISTDEGLPIDYYKISVLNNPAINDTTYGDSSSTLADIGIVDGDTILCTTNQVGTKEDRQIQKLEIAKAARIADGNARSSYTLTDLPTKYIGNSIVDNPNAGGLQDGRPWGLSTVLNGLTMWLDANNPNSYSGSGTTWADLSGVGADQTLVGAPTYTSGTPSYFSFDGISQYSTGSTPFVIPPNTYTKMVWFQFTAGADNNLVSSDTGGHYMFFGGTSTLYVGNANVGPPYIPGFGSTSSLDPDTWYCATVVFTAPQIYLYINGVLNDVDITYSAGGHGGDGSVNLACFSPGGNLLNGKIAEVYCYGRAITAAEVLQNFNATKAKYGL